MSQDPTSTSTEGAPSAGAPATPTVSSVEAAFAAVLQELERTGLPPADQFKVADKALELVRATLNHALGNVRMHMEQTAQGLRQELPR